MGMRGPAPRPMEIVRAEGNPGHIRVNKEIPKFKPVIPPPPTWLDAVAKREWKRIMPELKRLGLATSADFAALCAYCASWSRFVQAQRALKSRPATDDGKTGWHERAEIKTAREETNTLIRLAVQFGFTPSARGRIELPGQQETDEDLD